MIEEFDGFLDGIRDGIAYFTLTAQDGEEFWGEIAASEMNIQERRRFKCFLGEDSVEFIPIPDKVLTKERKAEIEKQLEKLGNLPENDY